MHDAVYSAGARNGVRDTLSAPSLEFARLQLTRCLRTRGSRSHREGGVAQRTQFLWDAGGGDNHLLRETKFAEAVRDCRAYFTSTTFKEKRWLDVVDQWMYFRKSQMMYFSTANSRGSSIVLLKDSVSVKI